MTNEKYNGWSNYATWRVNLEVIDGWGTYHTSEPDFETFDSVSNLAVHLKDYAAEIVESSGHSDGLMADYAIAFLGEVDWYEIAKNVADDYPKIIKNL